MTTALKKFCKKPGCSNLVSGSGYCAEHSNLERGYDKYRGNSAKRGYDHKWRAARQRFLEQNPICKHCFEAGKLTPAVVVDHIVPHKGDRTLFWDRDNWQPLCASCHSTKTAKEDGGFGNG